MVDLNKARRGDLSIPLNRQMYAIDFSGQVIPVLADTSGHISVDVTVADIIAVVSGPVTVMGKDLSGVDRFFHVLSGTRELSVAISGQMVQIASGAYQASGQYIQSGIGVLVSGQMVDLASGKYLASGQFVSISGQMVDLASGIYSHSGVGVLVSGQMVDLASGKYLASGQFVSISGQMVDIASGRYIHSGVGVLISGQMLSLASGAYLASGQYLVYSGQGVLISGQMMSVASGHIGAVAITDDAGATRAIVVPFNVDGWDQNDEALNVGARLLAFDDFIDKFNRLRVNKSGQGALAVATSGQDYVLTVIDSGTITVDSGIGVLISGQMVDLASGKYFASGQYLLHSGLGVLVSGQKVDLASGVYVYSGQGVLISGQAVQLASGAYIYSGQGVLISGQVVKAIAPSSLLAGYTLVGAQSGGVQLSSGAVVHVNVKNVTTSANIWMGPPGVRSGTGFLLQVGEEKAADIDNLNKVYLIGELSGVYASWLGEVE